MASRSTREDPIKSYNFIIAVPGFKRVGFESCSGLESSAEVTTYREGSDRRNTVKKSTGLVTFAPITLKRGVIIDVDNAEAGFDFDYWWMMVEHKDPNVRRNLSIIVLGNDNSEAIEYTVSLAIPTNFKAMSELNGTSNANLVEEITLEHEGFRKKGGAITPPLPGQSIASQLGIG